MGDLVVRRGELARALDMALDPSAVIFCGLGSSDVAWREVGSSRPTYFGSDPMGVVLPLAMGFALARPDRTTALLVGDGDLLMGLSALVSVTGADPSNLKVFVIANGHYETGGSMPLPGNDADIVGFAKAAGWRSANWAVDDLDGAVAAALATTGPALLGVRVELEAAPYGDPGRWSATEERVFFELRLNEMDEQEGRS